MDEERNAKRLDVGGGIATGATVLGFAMFPEMFSVYHWAPLVGHFCCPLRMRIAALAETLSVSALGATRQSASALSS